MAMSDSPGTNARRRPIEQIKNWNNVSVRMFLVGNCGGYSSEGFANQEVGTLQLLTARWAAQVEEGGYFDRGRDDTFVSQFTSD